MSAGTAHSVVEAKPWTRRLASALLEDVFSDDEEKTNKALADGNFRELFSTELDSAHKQYRKRVKAHVRAESDFWEETLKECEGRTW